MIRNYVTLVHPARRIYSSFWLICTRIARGITARRSTFVIANVRPRRFLPIYDSWARYERNGGTARHTDRHEHAHTDTDTDTETHTHTLMYTKHQLYIADKVEHDEMKTGETQALTIS